MSYIMKGSVKIGNMDIFQSVCEELSFGLELLQGKTTEGRFTRNGTHRVKLPNFRYPIVVNADTGQFWYESDDLASWREGHEVRLYDLNRFVSLYQLRVMEHETGLTIEGFQNEDGTITATIPYEDGRFVEGNLNYQGATIEAHGFEGQGCKKTVADLTAMIGKLEQEVIKDEYYHDTPGGMTYDIKAGY